MKIDQTNFLSLKKQVQEGTPEIHINGEIRFTKCDTPRLVNETFCRDLETEVTAKLLLDEIVGFGTFYKRFQELDPTFTIREMPIHRPYRKKSKNEVGDSENVFMVFPYAAGTDKALQEDVFGIEMIDYSERIFQSCIVPGIKSAFTNSAEILESINQVQPAIWNYLYSLGHEIGHYCGPWALHKAGLHNSPHWDFCSEMGADLASLHSMHEITPVLLGVFCLRIFWYMRKGMAKLDNDALCGLELLNFARKFQAIRKDGNQFRIDIAKLTTLFSIQVPSPSAPDHTYETFLMAQDIIYLCSPHVPDKLESI